MMTNITAHRAVRGSPSQANEGELLQTEAGQDAIQESAFGS